MKSCGRRGGAFRLERAGQESADHGPVDGRDVGIAGDLAGAAGTSDEAIVEEAYDRARGHTQEYFDHFLFVQLSDFFSHDSRTTISANAYIVKSLGCIQREDAFFQIEVASPSIIVS